MLPIICSVCSWFAVCDILFMLYHSLFIMCDGVSAMYYAWLVVCYALLVTYYLLLLNRDVLCIINGSRFARGSLSFATCYALLPVQSSSFITDYVLLMVHYSLLYRFVVCFASTPYSLWFTFHLQCIIHGSLYVIDCLLPIVFCMLFVIITCYHVHITSYLFRVTGYQYLYACLWCNLLSLLFVVCHLTFVIC